MSPIIAANFKANLTRLEVQTYTQTLDSILRDTTAQVSIFPSATALLHNNFRHFHIGAQNAYFAHNGGFTGEIGLSQLQEFGISSLLIGHSERRQIFLESQDFINKKFAFYKEAGFHIYYCIGESFDIRQKGEDALKVFLSNQLKDIDLTYPKLIVAYEPIWAIGTGVSASMEEIESTHTMLKSFTDAPLLYGGSVNSTNAADILSLKNVDGVLVGSASLDVHGFVKIINSCTKD